MSDKVETKPDATATEANVKLEQTAPPKPPTATVPTTDLTVEQRQLALEKANQELVERVAQQHRVLEKQMTVNVQLEKEMETISKSRQQEGAHAKALLLSSNGKFPHHAQPSLEAFYATLSEDQEKLFHEVVKAIPAQLEYQSHGVPIQQQPNLTDNQMEQAMLANIQNSWEATGGDGPEAQQRWLQPGGPQIWPAQFSAAQQGHSGPQIASQQTEPYSVPMHQPTAQRPFAPPVQHLPPSFRQVQPAQFAAPAPVVAPIGYNPAQAQPGSQGAPGPMLSEPGRPDGIRQMRLSDIPQGGE